MITIHMNTSYFDYILPSELIAQYPLPERSDSRMMVLDRRSDVIEHMHVSNLPDYLRAGDVMVVNNTRVMPARLYCRRMDTKGKAELLLVESVKEEVLENAAYVSIWKTLYKGRGRISEGLCLEFDNNMLRARIESKDQDGKVFVRFESAEPFMNLINKIGVMPLPPYIKRARDDFKMHEKDYLRYQTVYASQTGAIAAPTAGLHLTKSLIEKIVSRGADVAEVTLHVGIGTFLPVKTDKIEDHVMHSENYELTENMASKMRNSRNNGGRLLAIGTTTVRALETVAKEKGAIVPDSGKSRLFIAPGYQFKAVDAILTNFHLPRSTLLMLVSAFAGTDKIKRAYESAIKERYRFYSYGDCMLIL